MLIIFMLSRAEDYFVQTRAYSREIGGSILTRFEGIKDFKASSGLGLSFKST